MPAAVRLSSFGRWNGNVSHRLAERDAEILAASLSAPSDIDTLAGQSAHTVLDID